MAKLNLHVEGRRWFDSNGNTYHSVRIFRSGDLLTHIPSEYGYGDSYFQTAVGWLVKNGFPQLGVKHENGMPKFQGYHSEKKKLGISSSVVDVSRKKDL